MRLIDADALESKVLKWMPPDPCGIEEKEYPFETDIVVSLMMEIQEAPTIEPKQGEWIQLNTESEWWGYKCSQCGYGAFESSRSNFCPNCGARMKGEDDD